MSEHFMVLVADAISADGLQPLAEDDRFELVRETGLEGEALAAAIEGKDAVIVRSATHLTRAALARADRLKVIGRAGVGVDNIDLDAATERGIAVLNAPSGNTISAAELTFALMLSVVRRLPAADHSMKTGDWDRKRFNGTEVQGKTLGLVGAGRIGSEVARRARAFGMRVVAYDPYLSAERAAGLEIELTSLDSLLERADVVTLHTPLTDATRGLVGAAQLRRMKPGAVLINAARGGLVDEDALCDALEEGRLRGAAIDVYSKEPPSPDHRLRRLENVVLTPHLGAATREAQRNVALEIAHAVRGALLEGDLSRAVNAPAIGGEELQRLRPLLDLAERLGQLACALTDGAVDRVTVRYAGPGDDPKMPIAAAAIVGMLRRAVGPTAVNLVNAIHLAESRGITVERARLGAHGSSEEFIEVRLRTAGRDLRVAGAVVAGRHPRITRIDRYRVVVPPRGTLVVLRNRDVPGVIGQVGTALGEAGVNIGEFHQARMQAGGEALAALSVDGRLDEALMTRLRGMRDVLDVRQVDLG